MTGIDHYAALGLKPEDVFVIDRRNAAFLDGHRATPSFIPSKLSIMVRSTFLATASLCLFILTWIWTDYLKPLQIPLQLMGVISFVSASLTLLILILRIGQIATFQHSRQNIIGTMSILAATVVNCKPDDRSIIRTIIYVRSYRSYTQSTLICYAFYVPDTEREVVFKERIRGNILYQPLPPLHSTVLIAYFEKPIRFWSKKRQTFIL